MVTKILEAAMIAKLGIDVYIVKVTSFRSNLFIPFHNLDLQVVELFSFGTGRNKPFAESLEWRIERQLSWWLAWDGNSVFKIMKVDLLRLEWCFVLKSHQLCNQEIAYTRLCFITNYNSDHYQIAGFWSRCLKSLLNWEIKFLFGFDAMAIIDWQFSFDKLQAKDMDFF